MDTKKIIEQIKQNPKRTLSVIVLCLLWPIGLFFVFRNHPDWFKKNWFVATVVFWALFTSYVFAESVDQYSHNTTPTQQQTKSLIVTKSVTETKSIDFGEERVNSPDLLTGEQRVEQEGENGEKIVVYDVQFKNGVETSRTVVEEKIVKQPVNRIIKEGTKPRG